MLQAEYDTSLPVFHLFARMAMCQKASTGVQKLTLSYVLVLRVVAVVTWCSGFVDGWSWGGREVPNGCGWMAVFVTAKAEPHDIDTVILLPQNCTQQRAHEYALSLEWEGMLLTRLPEEICAVEDETDSSEYNGQPYYAQKEHHA